MVQFCSFKQFYVLVGDMVAVWLSLVVWFLGKWFVFPRVAGDAQEVSMYRSRVAKAGLVVSALAVRAWIGNWLAERMLDRWDHMHDPWRDDLWRTRP